MVCRVCPCVYVCVCVCVFVVLAFGPLHVWLDVLCARQYLFLFARRQRVVTASFLGRPVHATTGRKGTLHRWYQID